MDKLMAWLHKYIGGFFTWFQAITGLPTVKYGNVSVNYTYVVFMILVWILMWLLLP